MRLTTPHPVPLRLALSAAVLLLLFACARPAFFTRGAPTPKGEMLARIDHAGTTRVAVERDKKAPAWTAASMRNAAITPIHTLQFWATGATSLLDAPSRAFKPSDVYAPFGLLPGEELALSVPAADQVFGILHWLSPRDADQLKGAIMRSKRAAFDASGHIILAPAGADAYVQFDLSAPLNYTSVRIAWDAEPAPFQPQLWLNLDGETWVRQLQQERVTWYEPAEMKAKIGGTRHFWIRLGYEIPRGGSREGGLGPAPEQLTIRRIRIDREFQGPGQLKRWKSGRNQFDVQLTTGANPELEVRLTGGK